MEVSLVVSQVTWILLSVLVALLLVAFLLYGSYIKSVHRKYDHIPGPPRDSFFLGHIPTLWRAFKKEKHYYDLFVQWAEEHGPFVRLNILHKVTLLVMSPEGVKEYLMSTEYPKDPHIYGRLYHMCGERFLGSGLTASLDHDHWIKQRKIMGPAFSKSYIQGLIGTFNDQAEELMKKMEKQADGKTKVDVMNLLRRITLDIIAKVAFGLELETLHNDQTPFPHAMNMVTEGLKNVRVPFFQYLPWNRKIVKEIQESVRLLRRTGKECIEQRQKAMQNAKEVPLDVLTQILKTAAEEEESDMESMLDNFVNFFYAGHETTTNQLAFTIMELGRHPEIVAKLQAEVDDVIGVKKNIAYEDIRKLKYLSQVLKEALRLYPPATATLRWTEKENIIEGVRIPANTSLTFCMYIMGRLDKFFKDPLVFDPDRFRKDQPKPYFTYFPFSLGHRSCIGQRFAEMEAKVVMAKFLQRFDFQLVPPQSFKVLDAGTLRPLDEIVCQLKPRHHLSGYEE
nr:cholesterol 24-hydroxylase-like [Anolis sagrei ordinatus]